MKKSAIALGVCAVMLFASVAEARGRVGGFRGSSMSSKSRSTHRVPAPATPHTVRERDTGGSWFVPAVIGYAIGSSAGNNTVSAQPVTSSTVPVNLY